MNFSELTNTGIISWLVLILFLVIVIVLIVTVIINDLRKQFKPTVSTNATNTSMTSVQLEKASERALKELVNKINDEVSSKYMAHLKSSLNKVDATFQKNIEDSVKEFNSTLMTFQLDVQNKIEAANQRMLLATVESEKQVSAMIQSKKEETIGKIDNRLSEILVSYLNHSLEGVIDLSDQQDYIFENLEKNKALIIEDINNVKI